MSQFSLKRKEILSSKKLIEELFDSGKSIYSYPIKIKFLLKEDRAETDSPVLFSVTVPKKLIRSAVKRNLLKRRIREAYRLNKQFLVPNVPDGFQLHFMAIYTSKKIERYPKIERSVRKNISSKYLTADV